ncbi:MAG: VapE domain-containing protein [Cyanobacteriota bacterium]|jgi:hypothetical protein
MREHLIAELHALPDHWALVAVGANKRPYQPNWQNTPLSKAEAEQEITVGRARAVGVIAGPASGGLLFVDHDGISATDLLERIGAPMRSLPRSVTVTSGRDGRFQIIFSVPPRYWPDMVNRKVIKSGKNDEEGHSEQLEFRWSGHQSVVIGEHPTTSGYRWLNNLSPAKQEVAEAPLVLIQQLLQKNVEESLPISGTIVPFLDFITRDSRNLVETGGSPGNWNDDELRLSLDLIGTESWLHYRGLRPDMTASDAFAMHVAAATAQGVSFDERKAWHRFAGAQGRNPAPGTPEDRLISRVSFHTRQTRQQKDTVRPTSNQEEVNQPRSKPQKLEAGELLDLLRGRARGGKIRYNTFSQEIEIDGTIFEGAERFYLLLAEQGYKVGKELALDCLVQVAHENIYDPVVLYLEHVAATVEPGCIDVLASAYLRPEDCGAGKPTLYDEMLRCTLIGAVRRAFEPGCKHDTACVLMGDQGARKSSFWSALGGAFFSDSLGDISSKDDVMVLHRSWIMEWAELDHVMGRRHAGQIKSFLSQSTDIYRKPYGKAPGAFPRRGVIVGSTNRCSGFLQDETGNRRFWVIPTTRTQAEPIDTPSLLADRDAIWSAAVHAWRGGAGNYLPPELAEQVSRENESYQVENPWRIPVETWLQSPANRGRHITSEVLLTEAIQRPVDRQSRADQMQVGGIMRDLGYQRRRARINGVPTWVFLPEFPPV